MVGFTLSHTNLMNEDQSASRAIDSYYAQTKNRGTGTIIEDQELE